MAFRKMVCKNCGVEIDKDSPPCVGDEGPLDQLLVPREPTDWRPFLFVLGFVLTTGLIAWGIWWFVGHAAYHPAANIGGRIIGGVILAIGTVAGLIASVDKTPRRRTLTILAGIFGSLTLVVAMWTAIIYDKVPWKWNDGG